MDVSGRTDLQLVSWAFEGHAISCLCRSEGHASQRCWTLQTSDADGCQSLPEDVVDDIGLDIWEASRVLCNFMLQNIAVRHLITAAPGILELGAGAGLPSILSAAMGAKAVTLTDYDPQVVELEQENLRLNGVDEGKACVLDWRDRDAAEKLGKFDLVLGADLLYASSVVKDFIETVKVVLAPEGVMLFAHQIRRAITWDKARGLPRLEKVDAPLELLKAQAEDAKLVSKELLSLEPDQQAKDMGTEGCFLILAFAWQEEALKCLYSPTYSV